MELVASHGYNGMQKAVLESFIGTSWQMYFVHYIRAILKNIHNKYKADIAQEVKEALDNEQAIQALTDELADRGYLKATDTIERFRFDLWNYTALPKITGEVSGLLMEWN